MPRFKVEITEEGFVKVNEALIETGADIEMNDMADMLEAERIARDEMINDGRKTEAEAQLVVEINSHIGAEHQATVSVLNACGVAGVKKITFAF